NVIRRIAPDGAISTLAGTGQALFSGDGGPAIAAALKNPYDLRFSSTGDLFIADTGNHVIRRVDERGVITTVVGTGTAGFDGEQADAATCQLNSPSGVNFDAQGNMWIADTFNHRVRRVAAFLRR